MLHLTSVGVKGMLDVIECLLEVSALYVRPLKQPKFSGYLTKIVHVKSLTVNGGWNSWGSWTSCTATCGGGTKYRSRSCTNPSPSNGGKPCHGSSRDKPTCNTNGCPGIMELCQAIYLHCVQGTNKQFCTLVYSFVYNTTNAL